MVQAWLAQTGTGIKVHYIPNYCPHLDPDQALVGIHAQTRDSQSQSRHLQRLLQIPKCISCAKKCQKMGHLLRFRSPTFRVINPAQFSGSHGTGDVERSTALASHRIDLDNTLLQNAFDFLITNEAPLQTTRHIALRKKLDTSAPSFVAQALLVFCHQHMNPGSLAEKSKQTSSLASTNRDAYE